MAEWYEDGLAFQCTMCGNCCTGPEGYVLVSDEDVRAISTRLGMNEQAFLDSYTRDTHKGRSLTETRTEFGLDCVFLDRAKIPGKAVCGIYEDRPQQCRTWPFWTSNLKSAKTWRVAGRTCPGLNRGRVYPIEQIRILRDRVEI